MGIFWQASAARAQQQKPQYVSAGRVRRTAAGFTLVEMLIAMALTLIMVVAIAEFYGYVGTTVKDGRAAIEMSGQVSNAAAWLKSDLDLITVPVRPAADDGSGHGYLEVGEGIGYDLDPVFDGTAVVSTADANTNGIPDYIEDGVLHVNTVRSDNVSNLSGDTDDYLAFTIRSKGQTLVGQHNGGFVPSSLAEVIWYTGFTDVNGNGAWEIGEERFLYRRQLVIAPELSQLVPTTFSDLPSAIAGIQTYWQSNDVSAHVRQGSDGLFRIFANSLTDLARRENRFAHQPLPSFFPNVILLNSRTTSFALYSYSLANVGEDRMLSQLLAFDVRVFDPTAPIRADNTTVATSIGTVQPGDPGWAEAVTSNYLPVGLGAYVDIGYSRYAVGTSQFSVLPTGMAAGHTAIGYTYDTWATSYERDGYSQKGTAEYDLATNGVDDVIGGVTNGLVDDPLERDTVPPYNYPLRGLQVKIRVYEPGTRQMRQATIVADFIHE
jgi:type II secretory pathway pseudopilin PulG